MEQLPNGMELQVPQGAFPLSTDSMVLAHFAGTGSRKILDLGSGCGTLGLLLCAGDPRCQVTGLELDPAAHAAAQENILRNALGNRMKSICGDLRGLHQWFAPGSFDCVISNPPYFSAGPASREHTLARREDACSLAELLDAADFALKYGGDLYLVHRPERLAEIIALAAPHKLEAKRLGLVRHRSGSDPNLILLQLRKGGKPGLKWEDWTLHHGDGTPTPLYQKIYHCADSEAKGSRQRLP